MKLSPQVTRVIIGSPLSDTLEKKEENSETSGLACYAGVPLGTVLTSIQTVWGSFHRSSIRSLFWETTAQHFALKGMQEKQGKGATKRVFLAQKRKSFPPLLSPRKFPPENVSVQNEVRTKGQKERRKAAVSYASRGLSRNPHPPARKKGGGKENNRENKGDICSSLSPGYSFFFLLLTIDASGSAAQETEKRGEDADPI